MAFWKQAVISLILLVVFAIGFALFSYGPGMVPGLSSGTATAGIPGSGQAGVRERLAPLVVLSTVETADHGRHGQIGRHGPGDRKGDALPGSCRTGLAGQCRRRCAGRAGRRHRPA